MIRGFVFLCGLAGLFTFVLIVADTNPDSSEGKMYFPVCIQQTFSQVFSASERLPGGWP